jgi:hypothetical protein
MMSTYWGYVCESHDPPLVSEHWINHGDRTLADAFHLERAGEWPDVPVIVGVNDALGPEPEQVTFYDSGYGSAAPIYWLREHPRCEVALHNEYGERQLIGETARGGIILPIGGSA